MPDEWNLSGRAGIQQNKATSVQWKRGHRSTAQKKDLMPHAVQVPVELSPRSQRPRVVIIGAGFAGLNAAKALAPHDVEVFIVDRKNHHTFQPLLYQVAMAVLSPAEIATPIRSIFRGRQNVKVFLGTASGFDL